MNKSQLKIKVCGMRRREDIALLNNLSPDFLGYIFYPRSPRYVGSNPDPGIFSLPAPGIMKTGVFVDEDIRKIHKTAGLYALDAVQLHGEESPEQCRILKDSGLIVIKAVAADKIRHKPGRVYAGAVDFLLYDSPGPGKGGTGRKFNWDLIDQEAEIPFFLSGGIGTGDEEEIKSLKFESLAGIDVNSRFELAPGIKDIKALEKFINRIRNEE